MQGERNETCFFCRAAAYLLQRYINFINSARICQLFLKKRFLAVVLYCNVPQSYPLSWCRWHTAGGRVVSPHVNSVTPCVRCHCNIGKSRAPRSRSRPTRGKSGTSARQRAFSAMQKRHFCPCKVPLAAIECASLPQRECLSGSVTPYFTITLTVLPSSRRMMFTPLTGALSCLPERS